MEVMMIASSLPRCLDPSGSLLSSSAQIWGIFTITGKHLQLFLAGPESSLQNH